MSFWTALSPLLAICAFALLLSSRSLTPPVSSQQSLKLSDPPRSLFLLDANSGNVDEQEEFDPVIENLQPWDKRVVSEQELKDAASVDEAKTRCLVDPNDGLWRTRQPLKIFTQGPIDAMMRHVADSHSVRCDEGMFGMQVRIPQYFKKQYEHRVSNARDADLILWAVYMKCFSKSIIQKAGINPYVNADRLFNDTLTNLTMQYGDLSQRRDRRDWVVVFPSGAGAMVMPSWKRQVGTSIFLDTEASNWRKKGGTLYHRVEKDIVIPGYYHMPPGAFESIKPILARNITLLYCGYFYRSGPRSQIGKTLAPLYVNSTTIIIRNFCDLRSYLPHAKFCLVPGGWTPWTVRMYEAMLWACIPVLFDHDFVLPFPHFIPYDKFVIRWPSNAIGPELVEYLLSLSDRKVREMGAALVAERAKVWYNETHSPNAFQYIERYLEDKFCSWTLGEGELPETR